MAMSTVSKLMVDLEGQAPYKPKSRTAKQWVCGIAACALGCYLLASAVYAQHSRAAAYFGDYHQPVGNYNLPVGAAYVTTLDPLAVKPTGMDDDDNLATVNRTDVDLHRRLNLFSTWIAGKAGVKVGLIIAGLTTTHSAVEQCENGKYFSCGFGILGGVLMTAAGLFAPTSRKRFSAENYKNLTISLDQWDASNPHPAQRFLTNYHWSLAADPSRASYPIGGVHYHNLGSQRHRLIISPRRDRSHKRGDEDGSTSDGENVAYEWTDFGASGEHSTNPDDYNSLAGNVVDYIVSNDATSMCLTQCNNYAAYEVGQLQIGAGTDPDYDTECEFAPEMDGC